MGQALTINLLSKGVSFPRRRLFFCLKLNKIVDNHQSMKSFLAILIVCILGAVVLGFFAWSHLPDMISSRLSSTLKVNVSIADIGFGLQKQTIEKFTIDNPPGFSLSKAFKVATITVEAPILHYLHDEIVIDEITLDQVYIGLEFDSPRSTRGNWTTLMANAQTSHTSSEQIKKTVFIKKIVLNNIQTDLLYQSAGKIKHLPLISQIVLTNVSSQGGNLSDQLMNTVLGEMIKEVFIQENLKDALNQIFNAPQQLQNALKPLAPFFKP